MANRLEAGTAIDLGADNDCSGPCLHFPPAVLAGIELPERILIEGHDSTRVVGHRAIQGPVDQSVVLASPDLCEALTKGSSREQYFQVTIAKAGWWKMLWRDRGRAWALLVAFVVFAAALAGATANLLASQLAAGIAIGVFCVAALAAFLVLITAFQKTLKIDC
jgi:hypothetical protein